MASLHYTCKTNLFTHQYSLIGIANNREQRTSAAAYEYSTQNTVHRQSNRVNQESAMLPLSVRTSSSRFNYHAAALLDCNDEESLACWCNNRTFMVNTWKICISPGKTCWRMRCRLVYEHAIKGTAPLMLKMVLPKRQSFRLKSMNTLNTMQDNKEI